jgi:AAA domain
MAQVFKQKTQQERPGAADFRHFINYIKEFQTVPQVRGDIGAFAKHTEDLVEIMDEAGYDGFNRALITLMNRDRDVMTALSYSESPQDAPVGTLLSDVQPKSVHWLWYGRLPLGKLVMVDGDPGLGKTTLLFDVAARLTTGRHMPNENIPPAAGGVVLICLEDGLEDTIQPRMAKAGADLKKVVSIGYIKAQDADGNEYERPFSLAEDLTTLEAAINRVDAKLIIIDPIMAILGGKDTYKDNEVRATLAPLKALAERCNACIAMIRHVNKSGSDKLIYQGGGSIAFIGLARVGLMVTKNPDDEEQAILAVSKNNLSRKPSKLLYRIVCDLGTDDERPYIRWEGITTITDQEMTAKPTNVPGEGRQAILKCLKAHYPDPMTPQQVADELAPMSIDNVKKTLGRMVEDDQIKKEARGMYVAHSGA